MAALPPSHMAIFYGSAIFSQGQSSQADPSKLIDLLVVADNLPAWHHHNMTRHSAHYPRLLRLLGPQRLGLLFFPYAEIAGIRCKYGVVSANDLLRDLQTWDTLYCAGRLHKPVKIVGRPTDELHQALDGNLKCALGVSLLLNTMDSNPNISCSELDLYKGITRLSYDGDIRMMLAEDPRKIDNIVENNLDGFRQLYQPYLQDLVVEKAVSVQSDGSIAVRERSALQIPARLVGLSGDALRAELRRTVRRSSLAQTAKGPLSAGLGRSIRYSWRKFMKRIK